MPSEAWETTPQMAIAINSITVITGRFIANLVNDN